MFRPQSHKPTDDLEMKAIWQSASFSALLGLRELVVDEELRREHGAGREILAELRNLQSSIEQLKAQQEALVAEVASRPVVAYATLHDLNSEIYGLGSPIQAVIETYSDEVVARIPEIEAFSGGPTEGEAIVGLKAEIVSIFEELTSTDWEELGPVPQGWRRVLERLVVRTQHGGA